MERRLGKPGSRATAGRRSRVGRSRRTERRGFRSTAVRRTDTAMSQARLLACPACARHIRVSEPACLFCGLVLPDSFGAEPAIPPPPRLTRAGLVSYRARAIAASTAALVTASCGGSLTASTSETDASSAHDSAYGGGDTSALYGADSATGDSA